MNDLQILFVLLLFIVAFLYSSVGHGGASGYLALMAIFNFEPEVMKPTALLLNIFVSLVAFIQYYRSGYFHLKSFLPFAITSIPLSFIGGHFQLDENIYKQILGILLLIPVIRFLGFGNKEVNKTKPVQTGWAMIIGSIIGLISGMIGIGGGILLSPILLMLSWANQKQAAAISAAFILVNSLSGLGGQLRSGIEFYDTMYALVIIAFIGGLLGAYLGSHKFNVIILKRILGLVLFIASLKLLISI